ncbi:MAG: class I SAM-dependent methyltransferase [Nanoarchaeota archaeon]
MKSQLTETKSWLDDRFRQADKDGVYFAHQPIYGFRSGHSESGFIERHIRTYAIMRALAHIRFSTLLDVGSAEGYKAFVAKRLFKANVTCLDLSAEACKRAHELFHIKAVPGDIHRLPFNDSSFDVVLCSETIEHVEDVRKAVKELLRVTRKAVIITVPHETEQQVKEHKHEVHAHINRFTLSSYDYLKEKYAVKSRALGNPLVRLLGYGIEGMPLEHLKTMAYPRTVISLHNAVVAPLARAFFGKGSAACLIQSDQAFTNAFGSHQALLFVILKDNKCWNEKANRKISARQVIDVRVPLHKIRL